MTNTKLLQIRAKNGNIPIIAVRLIPTYSDLVKIPIKKLQRNKEIEILKIADKYKSNDLTSGKILVTKLTSNATEVEPHVWGSKVMRLAHEYIISNWDSVTSGDILVVSNE